MGVRIEYVLASGTVGWASCKIDIGAASASVTASYLDHALQDLVDAATAIMSGQHQSRASFWEEPGEYRWILDRTEMGLRVRILSFDRLWSNLPDDAGETILDETCAPSDFAIAVLTAAERVLNEHGLDGYRELWGEGDFPEASVELLRSQLSATSLPTGKSPP